jgi:alpha-glucosidase
MKKYLLFLLLGLFRLACPAQISFDTINQVLVIKHSKVANTQFEIDLNQIKYGNSNIKVKERFGSFQIKSSKVHSQGPYKVIKENEEWLLLKNKDVMLQLSCMAIDENHLKLYISSNQSPNKWSVPIKRLKNEHIFGGGVQFSNYDSYVKRFLNFTQENGIGRGGGSISKWTKLGGIVGESEATYCPISSFTTSQNRSFSIPGYHYNDIEFSTSEILITCYNQIFEINFGFANSESERKNQSKSVPYDLPSWATGSIVGLQGGSEAVNKKLNTLLSANAKINAIWIQDWVGKRNTKFGSRLNWTWQPDEQSYPNMENFIKSKNEQGIKVLGYVNPYFSESGKYTEIGIEKGYFLFSNADSSQIFDFGGMSGYMLDLHNQEAFDWMKSIIINELVERGFSGWMSDFAEWRPIPKDAEFRLEDLAMHNEYPVLWNRLNFEVINESDLELLFFNRSGGQTTNRYSSIMWLGDQMTDYTEEDGLLSVFDGYISSSHSGLPMIHSDAGGYTSIKKPIIKNVIRSSHLLSDWLILETFTPVLRTHEGLLPEQNAQVYDHAESIAFYAKCTKLNALLQPYFELMISDRNMLKKGFVEYPGEAIRQKFTKSMLVGNDIIIAFGENQVLSESWIQMSRPDDHKIKKETIIIYIRKNSLAEKLLGESIHIFE